MDQPSQLAFGIQVPEHSRQSTPREVGHSCTFSSRCVARYGDVGNNHAFWFCRRRWKPADQNGGREPDPRECLWSAEELYGNDLQLGSPGVCRVLRHSVWLFVAPTVVGLHEARSESQLQYSTPVCRP